MAFRLAVLSNRAQWQADSLEFTTMLFPSRRASTEGSYNSGEDIPTTLVSSEVAERPSVGMCFTAVNTEERQAQLHIGFVTLTEKFLSLLHRAFRPALVILDRLELRADHAAQGAQAALPKLSSAEYHMRLLLDEEKYYLFVWSTIRDEYSRIMGRKRRQDSPWIKYTASFSKRGHLPDESVFWSFPQRANHAPYLGTDELSHQERESQSTVNQLTVQIQEWQDKLISLKFPVISMILRRQTVLGYPTFRVSSEYSAAILACSVTQGTYVFHRKLHWRSTWIELTDSSLLWRCKKSYRHTITNLCFWTQEHLQPMRMNGEKIQNFGIHIHRYFARKCSTWNLPSHTDELIRKIVWLNNRGIRSRKCISKNSLILRH